MWVSSGDGTRRDSRGVLLKTLWGRLGEETGWMATPGHGRPEGQPRSDGRWLAGNCSLRDTGASADALSTPIPGEAERNPGRDGHPSEQVCNSGHVFLDLRLASLGSPTRTICLFGLLCNGLNGPLPRFLPRDPLCCRRAGWTAPGVMPAPSPGPRCLEPPGCCARGLCWGQKWG